MTKSSYVKYFSIFLLTIFALLSQPTKALGQSPASDPVQSPECPSTVWMCAEMKDLDVGDPGSHRLQLKASNLPVKNEASGQPVDIHIVCGISTDEGDLFTTGNVATDKRLCIGDQTLSKLRDPKYDYEVAYTRGTNPFRTTDGNADLIVRPQTRRPQAHSCFLVWENPVDVVDADGGAQNQASGTVSSLTYATFRTAGAPAACQSFRADPYGRTFNEQLKPVPGATVSLFDYASKALYKLAGVTNPVTTLEDGQFNFNIEPGTTYLQTNLFNAIDAVHPNATLAYSNIYRYGDPIVETLEKAEQRDIPVRGGNAPVLKLMDYSNLQFGDSTRIEGKASWPLSMVTVKQGETVLLERNANKFGVFNFMVPNEQIDPSQKITVHISEVDLTKDTLSPVENGRSADTAIDAIPRYLEGYAYNTAGVKVPFANVQIKLKVSDQVYYETQADATAFYSVGPRFLPILPYYIEVQAPRPGTVGSGIPTGTVGTPVGGGSGSGISKISVPVYAKQNKDYHISQNINIMAGTKAGVKVDPKAVLTDTDNLGKNSNASDTGATGNRRGFDLLRQDRTNTDVGESNPQSLAMLIVMLIVLFGIIAGVLAVYLKRKRDGMGDSSENGSHMKTYVSEKE